MGNMETGSENGLVKINSQRKTVLEVMAPPRAAGEGPEACLPRLYYSR